MPALLIYTPKITQRVNYIFQLFFNSLIRTPYTITSDEAAFKAYSGPKLNYSSVTFSINELQIIPCGLLTETEIQAQSISVTEWNNLKIFFSTGQGSIPFDVFSASFYLVSRYEEYLSYKPDEHNRFHHNYSLAFKNNFLDKPLINLWAGELKKILLVKYPAILISENKYSYIPTVDVDVAYAHLGRNMAITIGSYLKAISKFQIKTVIEKKLVLLHLKKDPYDTFEYQEKLFQKYKLSPIYFMLAGKRGRNDKNISPENHRFKKLVKYLSSFAEIGIHPSYHSGNDPKIVAWEIENVQRNISKKISCSRQHFLRISLPDTYRCLAELGITDDYSMGYPSHYGFRASICIPFFFYDLKKETVLPVKVHSMIAMDGTFKDFLKYSLTESISTTKELIGQVRNCKGEYIDIWHNQNLIDNKKYIPWRTLFEEVAKMATAEL